MFVRKPVRMVNDDYVSRREFDLFQKNMEMQFKQIRKDMTEDIKHIYEKMDEGFNSVNSLVKKNKSANRRSLGLISLFGVSTLGVVIFILERMFAITESQATNAANIEHMRQMLCASLGC